VVDDVIAEVEHPRAVDRTEPDRIDAEPFQVGQTLHDSFQIAFAVPVAVLKRHRLRDAAQLYRALHATSCNDARFQEG
jgi:hypothetical protein